MKKLIVAATCLISMNLYAGSRVAERIKIKNGRGCSSFAFDPATIEKSGVSITLNNLVNVCYDASYKIYEFSTPKADITSRSKTKATLIFSAGNGEQECYDNINLSDYRAEFNLKRNEKRTMNIVAHGSNLSFDEANSWVCSELFVGR